MIAFDSTRKEEQCALRRSMDLFTEKSSESGKAQAADSKTSSAEAFGLPPEYHRVLSVCRRHCPPIFSFADFS